MKQHEMMWTPIAIPMWCATTWTTWMMQRFSRLFLELANRHYRIGAVLVSVRI